MRWLICVATAICLLAAPGARPDDWRADSTHLKQATASGHAPLHRAPAIAPIREVALPSPPRVAIAIVAAPLLAVAHAQPARISSRGPPET